MFLFGFIAGILITLLFAIYWGAKLGRREEELNMQLIKEFQDKLTDTQDVNEQKFYKRYES